MEVFKKQPPSAEKFEGGHFDHVGGNLKCWRKFQKSRAEFVFQENINKSLLACIFCKKHGQNRKILMATRLTNYSLW